MSHLIVAALPVLNVGFCASKPDRRRPGASFDGGRYGSTAPLTLAIRYHHDLSLLLRAALDRSLDYARDYADGLLPHWRRDLQAHGQVLGSPVLDQLRDWRGHRH